MVKPEIEKENLNKPVENETIKKPAKVTKEIKPPAALRPGVDWDGIEAEITSEPLSSPDPDWDEILRKWGYDPNSFQIVEPVKVSQWEVISDGQVQTLWSYKAGVKRKSGYKDVSYLDLVKEIKRHRKLSKNLPGGDQVFVACIADTQFGKSDGDGVAGTVKRFVEAIEGVDERIRELRKIDRKIGTLLVAGMGDIIENCEGQYASQPFSVELNRREQIRVARRLIRDAIARWSKLFPRVIVTAVPGNHGENRSNGKAFTSPGDNDDVTIFEMLAEVFAANPEAYGHIEWYIPDDEVWTVFDLAGTRIGFSHGHVASSSSVSPQARLRKWWEQQAFCNSDIGSAKILVTAHYHHFSVINYSLDKTHIQCPSLESQSDWWMNLTGEKSFPGILTFVLGENGYQDLQVI